MRLLLDTHILIWLVNETSRVSVSEKRAMAEASSLLVSAASLWELRIKWQTLDRQGRHKGVLDPADALAFADAQRWQVVPLAAADSIVRLNPPIGHRDPFDEMLLVQAGRLGGRLLTRDRLLRNHPLALAF